MEEMKGTEMKLTINDVLGIRHAEVEIESGKVVEVVGPNASGKTSLAVCAQAVLARESNPLGLSAADAKRAYAHDGADDARVDLIEPDGDHTTWFSSSGKMQHNILEPQAKPEAVGLVDFTAKRGAKERAGSIPRSTATRPSHVEREGAGSLITNTWRQMTWKAY